MKICIVASIYQVKILKVHTLFDLLINFLGKIIPIINNLLQKEIFPTVQVAKFFVEIVSI